MGGGWGFYLFYLISLGLLTKVNAEIVVNKRDFYWSWILILVTVAIQLGNTRYFCPKRLKPLKDWNEKFAMWLALENKNLPQSKWWNFYKCRRLSSYMNGIFLVFIFRTLLLTRGCTESVPNNHWGGIFRHKISIKFVPSGCRCDLRLTVFVEILVES